jgi:17beta-estradiol 17-dehydrogenase / very-long-chain 3-oxoacyl-CoA reductase
MSKMRPSALIPLPAAYVRSVLSKIGLSCGAAFTGRPNTSTPYWSHSLFDWLIHVIGWKGAVVSYTHGLHQRIRKRALRKAARAAGKTE